MKKSISMRAVWFFIGSLFLLIFLVGIFFAANSSNKKMGSLSSNVVNIKNEGQDIKGSGEREDFSENSADEEISSDESNVINEGGGSGKSVSLNPECKTVSVSYALKHFNENSVCNEYSEEICIDKTITCSVEVQNLDFSVVGEFVIEFRFSNAASEEIGFESDSKIIRAREILLFEKSLQVLGSGADGDLNCDFFITDVPQKEVCS